MNRQAQREIRFGLSALALSGLLFALGILLRGPIDLADPGSCCRAAVPPNYVPAWIIILVGGVLHLYGVLGLYRYLTYRADSLTAFLAAWLRIAGNALFLPLPAFLAVDAPAVAELYQAGQPEAIAVVEAHFTGPVGMALLGVGAVADLVATLLFAIVIWRDGRLPRWTAVAFALSLPLLVFPVTLPSEFLGAVLLLISAAAIARKGWQESGTAAGL